MGTGSRWLLGIDLGGSSLRVAVAGPDGAIVERRLSPVDPGVGPERILDAIVEEGRAALAACGRAQPAAVGVSTPGIVDPAAGIVLAARNLRGWTNVPVRAALEAGFGAPVAVENDVNLAALGEQRWGAGRAHDPLVFLAIGTGVGAGIIVNARLHRGAHLAAGEVNRIPSGMLDAHGREVGVEDVAGGPAIVRRAAERGVRLPDGPLTAEAVFALAGQGDARAVAAVDDAARALARAAAALIATVDPAIIVVGGGLSLQGEALLAPVRQQIAVLGYAGTPIVLSALGVDAQLHGAIAAALELCMMQRSPPASAIDRKGPAHDR